VRERERERERRRRKSDTRFRIARHETNVFHDTETKREARRRRRRRRRHFVKPFKRPRWRRRGGRRKREGPCSLGANKTADERGPSFLPRIPAPGPGASLLKGGALSRWLVEIFLKETARSENARARRETVWRREEICQPMMHVGEHALPPDLWARRVSSYDSAA